MKLMMHRMPTPSQPPPCSKGRGQNPAPSPFLRGRRGRGILHPPAAGGLGWALLLLALPAWTHAAPKPAPAPSIPYELDADRTPTLVTHGDCLLKHARLYTVTNGVVADGDILVRGGKIAAIGPNLSAPSGVMVIDETGNSITPGIVDAHSHIAEDSTNEGSDSITPEVNIRDVTDPQSLAIYRGLSSGVTESLLLHGSANPIGGQSVVIKMKWRHPVEELFFPDAPRFVKFALGENVKQSFEADSPGPKRFPQTRMGVEAVYRRAFTEARRYQAAWDKYDRQKQTDPNALPPRRDLRLETLVAIMHGEIQVMCHCYRADEMLMLMRVSHEFGFKIAAFHHALEAYKIIPELKANHIAVSEFADAWAYKVEADEAIPYDAAMCLKAGLVTSVNSDNSSGTYHLNLEAANCMKYGGLDETQALDLITINPAMQLGIDKHVGSLEVGKDADLAVWSGYPLSVYTKCLQTYIDGELYFQRRDAFGVDKTSPHPTGVTQCSADHENLPTPAPSSIYAITGGTVHPVSGPEIANGTLILENGKIAAVGANVPVPAGAVIVDAKGLDVYPGLIDGGSVLGLSEIGAIAATVDTTDGGRFQPDLVALTAVNPASEHFPVARMNGLTTTLTRPGGALIAGQGSVIDLAGWTPDQMSLHSPAALMVYFPEGLAGIPEAFRGFISPGQMKKLGDAEQARIKSLRDDFDAATRYAAGRAAGTVEPDAQMDAMVPYVTGRAPVMFYANSLHGIRGALAFAARYHLKMILAGAEESWKIAPELAEKKIPVIYTLPIFNSLESQSPIDDYDPYDAIWAAPGLLKKAGVLFCFASESAEMAKNLPRQTGMTCAYGLAHDDAVRALTLDAAKVLGVADQVGSLEPGKIGNVIVTDGDPLEVTTHLHDLFIGGQAIPLESKHTRLYKEYSQRLSPNAGLVPVETR